jgi:hypothetical protein
MATTTPNFGWSVPTSTDLVKDGATAIETLGDSIDASLVDLKGGTTGQVLAKNSNTDMDFTWTAIDPLVILDAKGDLITATAADTPARLAVGTNGQVLTADSTASTGLAWAAAATGGMTLLATHTLSGATSTISSISGAYKQLVAYIELPQNATADGNFQIAPNGDTALAFLVGVKIATTVYDVTGGYITTFSTSNRSTTNFSATLVIDNYTNTTTLKPVQYYGYYAPTSGFGQFMSSGVYASASAVTSLVFSNSGGNLTSGTVYLYGVK